MKGISYEEIVITGINAGMDGDDYCRTKITIIVDYVKI